MYTIIYSGRQGYQQKKKNLSDPVANGELAKLSSERCTFEKVNHLNKSYNTEIYTSHKRQNINRVRICWTLKTYQMSTGFFFWFLTKTGSGTWHLWAVGLTFLFVVGITESGTRLNEWNTQLRRSIKRFKYLLNIILIDKISCII